MSRFNKPAWLGGMILILILAFQATGWVKTRMSSELPPFNAVYFLKDEEISALKKRAGDGDWVSASLLARYYSYARKPDEMVRWRKVAEENKSRPGL